MMYKIRVSLVVSLASIGLWAGSATAALTPGTDWIVPSSGSLMACQNGSPVSTFVRWFGSGGWTINMDVWTTVSGGPQNVDLIIEADADIQVGNSPYYLWQIGYFQGQCPLPGDNWDVWHQSMTDGAAFIPVTAECAATTVTYNAAGYEPYSIEEIPGYQGFSLGVNTVFRNNSPTPVPTGDAVWTVNIDSNTCTFPEAEGNGGDSGLPENYRPIGLDGSGELPNTQ